MRFLLQAVACLCAACLCDGFQPVVGTVSNVTSVINARICKKEWYAASPLERGFAAHANEYTATVKSLCTKHLTSETASAWLQQVNGSQPLSDNLFSQVCQSGQPRQWIEPLAGVLRHPLMFCQGDGQGERTNLMRADWILLADQKVLTPGAKKFMFDAGGTRFMDAMYWFTSQYKKRGIVFDHVYVWEAVYRGTKSYWATTPPAVRAEWEPKLTFYDGEPVNNTHGSKNNVVERIFQMCKPEDFCSFKLDIDTPSVEVPMVERLLNAPAASIAKLDEFFFEHHVHGLMEEIWKRRVKGTFLDSYEMFQKLRRMGVRAHSWV